MKLSDEKGLSHEPAKGADAPRSCPQCGNSDRHKANCSQNETTLDMPYGTLRTAVSPIPPRDATEMDLLLYEIGNHLAEGKLPAREGVDGYGRWAGRCTVYLQQLYDAARTSLATTGEEDGSDAWLARTMPADLYEWYGHLQLHLTEHDAHHAGRAFREAWPQIRDWFVREVRVARSNRDSWKHWANVHRSQIREYEAETIAANTAKEAIRVELARAERNLEGANAANARLRAKLDERERKVESLRAECGLRQIQGYWEGADRTLKAMRKYLTHDQTCPEYMNGTIAKCTCGLRDAIDAARQSAIEQSRNVEGSR